jgi:two-component system phosphate regulon sensor histidine kinase PhoR
MNARNTFFLCSWFVVQTTFIIVWFLLDLTQHKIDTGLYWLLSVIFSLISSAALSLIAVWIMGRSIRDLAPIAQALFDGDSFRRLSRVNNAQLKEAVAEFADELEDSLARVRTERDLMHAVLESMEEGVLVSDRSGQIVRTNDTIRRWFSISKNILGKSVSHVLADPVLNRKLTEARLQGEAKHIEINVEDRFYMVRIAPLSNVEGGSVTVFHDVTELRRLERVRRDFVANVSHELRTPIFAIQGAAETLLDGGLEDPTHAKHFAALIERNASRLAKILSDLLELSKAESSGEGLDTDALDLPNIVAELLQERTELFAAKKITWSSTAQENLPHAAGNTRAIRRVLANLLENAIHYTEPGGAVSVKLSATRDAVNIEISDSGVGIAPHHLPRIFERFYRVDAGRSRAQGGTGLGLSIVRHFVHAMGGEICVESTPGKGSTFRISLGRFQRAANHQ